MELKEGTRLHGGKYSIVGVLGQGGFGITYLAKCKETVSGDLGNFLVDVNIALKEFYVRDDCRRGDDGQTVEVPSEGAAGKVEQYRKKFVKEARSISQLNHPNIIHVSEVFEENGTVYYAMKYMEGGSLRDLVRKQGKPLSETLALRYIRQIADALCYMHDRRICHLDVKPANIMLDSDDNAILIDFGIAKRYNDNGQESTAAPLGISKGYTPPEQYQDMLHDFSPTSDVYSLGATLYFLLTAHDPAEAWTVLEKGIGTKPEAVTDRVWDIVCKAMQPIRKERYSSMRQFAGAIDGKQTAATDDDDEVTMVMQNDAAPQRSSETANAATAKPKRGLKRAVLAWAIGLVVAVAAVFTYHRLFRMVQVSDMVLGTGADTMKYTGGLQAGKPQGFGRAVYADGRIYEGRFDNGLREDTCARFTYPSKRVFTGVFAADTIQRGRVTSKDNTMYYIGDFNHDAPWNGSWYYTDTDERCFVVKNGKTLTI